MEQKTYINFDNVARKRATSLFVGTLLAKSTLYIDPAPTCHAQTPTDNEIRERRPVLGFRWLLSRDVKTGMGRGVLMKHHSYSTTGNGCNYHAIESIDVRTMGFASNIE